MNTSGEYLVDAWLDFVTKLQKYTFLASLHIVDQVEISAKHETVAAGGDVICENSNLLQSLTFDCTKWWNKDSCAWSRTQNGC